MDFVTTRSATPLTSKVEGEEIVQPCEMGNHRTKLPLFETGGQGLQYYPHVKIRLSESAKEKDPKTKRILRSQITGTTSKSRLVGKGISSSYYFNYFTEDGTPTGVDHFEELVDIGIVEGFITQLSDQKYLILDKVESKKKDLRKTIVDDMELLHELYNLVMGVISIRMGHDKIRENAGTKQTEAKSKSSRSRKKGK